jgi:acetyl-CoA carboxylase biotin carboxylase subunit
MRIVWKKKDLKTGIEAGRREAKGAFGDESVYLEKYIEEPRHVEFQVLADNHGNVVHLFERECSIQRRHQKIIEESPSMVLDPQLRQAMGEVATKVISTAKYNNAGTVEFLLDKDKNFYFLEVNARLQVEHPVTEFITGIDLVHQQIHIASGKMLAFKQGDLEQKGHAIECRIYAEDPLNDFLPSSGKILYLKEPNGPGVRHDGGIYSGCDVPIFYDPILAKLIVWSEDRDKACVKMVKALNDYVIIGINTTIDFLKDVIEHKNFRTGETTTSFINTHFENWTGTEKDDSVIRIIAAAAAFDKLNKPKQSRDTGQNQVASPSPWQTLGKWRIGGL